MKYKIFIVFIFLITFCNSVSAQSKSISRGSTSGGADVGYLIRTFLKASKDPTYGIPYDLYRGNRSLTVNEDEDPSRYDSEWTSVYAYKGKLTANGRYLNVNGLYKTWNIVLSGPHSGAILLELNSASEIDDRQQTQMKNMVVKSVPCNTLQKHKNGSSFDAYLYSAKNGYVMIYFNWGASAAWMTIYASGDWSEIIRVWNKNTQW